MTNFHRPLSAELRAKLIADCMGTLPPNQRWNAVYTAALEQIRAAQAVAASQATRGFEPAELAD